MATSTRPRDPNTTRPSYRAISAELGFPGEEILFLSDVEAELDAAGSAAYRTCRLSRPEDYGENAGEVASNHPVYTSFDDIRLDDIR